MIVIENKNELNLIYIPINLHKNASNLYQLRLISEDKAKYYDVNIADSALSTLYVSATVNFKNMDDGEYQFILKDNGSVLSTGLLRIGEIKLDKVKYEQSRTRKEYRG